MATITLAKARRIIRATLTTAEEKGFAPLAVVVVDAGGCPIAFERANGATSGRYHLAIGKCAGALSLGIDSRDVATMAAERPTFVTNLGQIIPNGVVPSPGAVVIRAKNGEILGAVGASGDTGDNDEAAVMEGLKAAGYMTDA